MTDPSSGKPAWGTRVSTGSGAEAALERAYAVCVAKARRNIVRLADEPKSGAFATDGNYFGFAEGFFDIGNWTSSFFTGMALLAYATDQAPSLLQQTERLAGVYREKVGRRCRDTMHDLGFLYSLYSVALHRLVGDTNQRLLGIQAADELAKRFHARGGFIRAWGRMDEVGTEYDGLAIIDCMMNLPLLFWAGRETGDPKYRGIAVRHAETTLRHFVRADGSVCHAYRFDSATGRPLGPDNYCGHGVDSHWARGTAWAVYGFGLAHGYTDDARYLDVALRLAHKFVDSLDADVVPLWDFRLPPGAERLRDSSAGAVAVSGLMELLKYRPLESRLARAADTLLRRLCEDDYLDSNLRRPGLLRNGQVGGGQSAAKNTYAIWGDYFLMEALARRLYGVATFW